MHPCPPGWKPGLNRNGRTAAPPGVTRHRGRPYHSVDGCNGWGYGGERGGTSCMNRAVPHRTAESAMTFASISRGLSVSIFWSAVAAAQTLPTAAKIEAVPLELTMPERYQVTEVLEPIRKVTLVAPRDGLIRSIEARLGAVVREIGRNRPARPHRSRRTDEDGRRRASRKQAMLKSNKNYPDVYQAQVEAAQARVELAGPRAGPVHSASPIRGPRGRAAVMCRSIRAERCRYRRARRRVEPQGNAAGRPPQRGCKLVALRFRSKGARSPPRCRPSFRCPTGSKSCVSWPRPWAPPFSSWPIPRANSSRACESRAHRSLDPHRNGP